MATIPLTRGRVALVDDVDMPLVLPFAWRAARASNGIGWYARTIVYVRGSGNKVSLSMHELLLNGVLGGDHKNGDGLDNRRENLRPCTQSQNCGNRAKQNTRATSRFKGVAWRRDLSRWHAYVRVAGRARHLGYFDDEMSAARAYNAAAHAQWGEFARLNEVD